MADHRNLPVVPEQGVAEPLGRVRGLEAPDGGDRRKRVAHAPEHVGGLAGPVLPAVPDQVRFCAAGRGLPGHEFRLRPAPGRERPHRVNLGGFGLGVVHQQKHPGYTGTFERAAISPT